MWHIHGMNIRELDLNLLVGFEALLIERNVSHAASRVHLSQPAMSNLLARLRKTFDDPLFERAGQGMAPTARARELATPVGAALNAIRQAIGERPSFNPATAEVRYTIATTDYAEATVLPRLLPILKRAAPRVTLQIKRLKGIFDLPVAELELWDFALGFFPLPLPPGAGINGTALFNDRFVGMLRRRHPMRNRKLTLRRFLSLEHIRVNYSEEGPGLIGDAIQKVGHRRKVGLIVPHLLTVPFLAAQSEMLGIVPLRLAHAVSRSLGLRIIELPLKISPLSISLVWHERHQQNAAHRWLREFVPQSTR
jgi:DNA-binding transcriptional LysR family regulator